MKYKIWRHQSISKQFFIGCMLIALSWLQLVWMASPSRLCMMIYPGQWRLHQSFSYTNYFCRSNLYSSKDSTPKLSDINHIRIACEWNLIKTLNKQTFDKQCSMLDGTVFCLILPRKQRIKFWRSMGLFRFGRCPNENPYGDKFLLCNFNESFNYNCQEIQSRSSEE